MSRWALSVALVLLWELGGRLLLDGPRAALFVPLPSTVAAAAFALAADGSLAVDVLRSTARVLTGAGAAVLVGVPIGAAMATAPRLGAALEGPLRLLRPIPPVAWVPLTVLWFGTGDRQQIAVLFFAAAYVVVSGTMAAVAGVPGAWLAAARNLGATGLAVPLRVGIPAALPGVAAAVREAVGTAWFVLVAAELLAASEGLGVLILEGRDLLEPARTFVGIGALAACAAATDAGLARLQARAGRGR